MKKNHNYQVRQEVLDVFEENCTLAMFCRVKKPDGVGAIPPGFVHEKQVEQLLREVGLAYLSFKTAKLQKELFEHPDRKSKGDLISFEDLKRWVEKYVHKYTDEGKIKEALGFFDTNGSGKIGSSDMKSMLTSFGQTETNYVLGDKEVNEIIRIGRQSSDAMGDINVSLMTKKLAGNWKERKQMSIAAAEKVAHQFEK